MSIMLIILRQVVIMFLLAFIGYVMFRTGRITNEGSKTIGNILIYLSLPAVIINSFQVEKTPGIGRMLLWGTVLALFVIVLSAVCSRLIMGKDPIENFSGTFSNPGFFGVPIIVASLSSGAVFYVSSFIAFINIGQWTYGRWLLERGSSGQKTTVKSFLKRLITAPFMVAIIIGLFFFIPGWKIPAIPARCIDFLAGINTPLAMFTIGIYLAQTDLLRMFTKARLYLLTAVRMLLVPLITIAVLCFLPASMHELKMALLIVAACPVGSNAAVYAHLYGGDYSYAVETVVISTLFSIVSIPLLAGLASLVWH